VTNGKDIDDHKLQYFPNFLKRKATDSFAKYETAHLVTTWDEVHRAFISRLSEIRSEG
jgi:hypothetical protein